MVYPGGIPAGDLTHVTDPFFTTRPDGLGMSVLFYDTADPTYLGYAFYGDAQLALVRR